MLYACVRVSRDNVTSQKTWVVYKTDVETMILAQGKLSLRLMAGNGIVLRNEGTVPCILILSIQSE